MNTSVDKSVGSRATTKRTIFIKDASCPRQTAQPQPMKMLIREEMRTPMRSSEYGNGGTPYSHHSKRSSGVLSSCYSALDFKIPTANLYHGTG